VALHGHGVGVGVLDPADDADGARLDLDRLALALALDELAVGLDRAAGGQVGDLVLVVGQVVLGDDLDRVVAGAVVELR
jgi:hypothetical protein